MNSIVSLFKLTSKEQFYAEDDGPAKRTHSQNMADVRNVLGLMTDSEEEEESDTESDGNDDVE